MQIQALQLNTLKGINYNTPRNNGNKKETLSFGIGNPLTAANKARKSVYNVVTEGLGHTFGALGSTRPMQSLIDYLQDKNYVRHLAAFVGVTLSSFYMLDTAKSKTIKKEDKMPLVVNQGAVCALSTVGGYTLDKYLDKKLENFTDKFHIASMSNNEHKKIFLQLKDDPKNLELLEEAAENLKSPRQIFNKKLLEVIDNPQKFEELKNSKDFVKSEYARNLVKEVEASANPRKLLEDNYNSTKEFGKELNEKFKFGADLKKKLAKLVKKGEADSVVTELLDETKSLIASEKQKLKEMALKMAEEQKISLSSAKRILKEEMDLLGKTGELYIKKMAGSKILQEKFCRQGFNNAINMIAENDQKLSINQKGFRYGKTIMIFAMIYRFFAPVFATPVANKISDNIEARKKAKVKTA